MLRCVIRDESGKQAKSPNREMRGRIVRQSVLVLFLVPFSWPVVPASSRLQQPRSRPALRLWHRQPKGRSAESSSTPQAQRTADTAPPQADLKRPSSASTVRLSSPQARKVRPRTMAHRPQKPNDRGPIDPKIFRQPQVGKANSNARYPCEDSRETGGKATREAAGVGDS